MKAFEMCDSCKERKAERRRALYIAQNIKRKEYRAAWYQANKERCWVSMKKYRDANPEKIAAIQRRAYLKRKLKLQYPTDREGRSTIPPKATESSRPHLPQPPEKPSLDPQQAAGGNPKTCSCTSLECPICNPQETR